MAEESIIKKVKKIDCHKCGATVDVSDARQRAFDRYFRWLPFAAGRSETLHSLVRRSLTRRHRWSGAGCSIGVGTRAP